MRLTDVQVQLFRNIVDSSQVSIEPDITCLVGRNESGKSTFLHALYRLNPARPNVRFSAGEQYPAWREKKDRMRGRLEDATPIRARFVLDDRDLAVVAERFGPGALRQPEVTVTRSYAGTSVFGCDVDEAAICATILRDTSVPSAAAARGASVTTVPQLQELARELALSGDTDLTRGAASISLRLAAMLGEAASVGQALRELLSPRLPRFFFFDDYATLSGRIQLRRLLTAPADTLSDEELTALSLLTLAGAEADDLLTASYERRRRELENVANTLTEDALKYWSQNTGLRVIIDVATDAAGEDELHIRLWDARHYLSLPFDQRSNGFRWFFSFLAAFAPFEWAQEPLVILLDEPALGLHARAQHDFLRFIGERLAQAGHQVIYSTHSPFMIDAVRLERVRVVEDRGRDVGSVVTGDLASADAETLSPLQGALASALVRTAFAGRPVLLVDSPETAATLTRMADVVSRSGRATLTPAWSIVPASGLHGVAAIAALLGHSESATILITGESASSAALATAGRLGVLKGAPVITLAESGETAAPATLEAFFDSSDQPIRLEAEAFSPATLDRFEGLFVRINATAPQPSRTTVPSRW